MEQTIDNLTTCIKVIEIDDDAGIKSALSKLQIRSQLYYCGLGKETGQKKKTSLTMSPSKCIYSIDHVRLVSRSILKPDCDSSPNIVCPCMTIEVSWGVTVPFVERQENGNQVVKKVARP